MPAPATGPAPPPRRAAAAAARRRCAAAAALALALALAAPAPAAAYISESSYYSSSYGYGYKGARAFVVSVPPGGCWTLPLTLGSSHFSYEASAPAVSATPPEGCALSDVRVSKLYVLNTCANPRNNKDACATTDTGGSGAFPVVAPTVPADGYEDPTTCPAVFASGDPSALLTLPDAQDGSTFDKASGLCAASPSAFIFVQNACAPANASGGAPITVTVDVEYEYFTSSCSSGWDAWSIVVAVLIGGALVAGLAACLWQRRRRVRYPPPAAVQMAGGYGGYGAGYGGSSAYGAGGAPYGAYGAGGAWGAPAAPAYGYPVNAPPPGYPAAPQPPATAGSNGGSMYGGGIDGDTSGLAPPGGSAPPPKA